MSAQLMAQLNGDSIQVRQARARVKAQLRAGEVDLLSVLRDPPLRTTAYELVRALPTMGKYRADTLFIQTGVYPLTYAVDLSEQDRGRIVLYLRGKGRL